MKNLISTVISISVLLFSTQALAQSQDCSVIDKQIVTIDNHADNFYSLANYQFDDKALLDSLRDHSRIFNDRSFEKMLNTIELTIAREENDLMIKIAPLSRYLNEWNLQHCS